MQRDFRFGQIVAWSGTLESIPAGFRLCDGTQNTPDLRDRFIVGPDLTFAVGQEGGTLTHAHDFTSDLHRHNTPAGAAINQAPILNRLTSYETVTGTTDDSANVPPYYALFFIMSN